MVLPPDDSVAGSVNESVTGALAWPVTSKRPAFVRSVALTVLFTPGNAFPKLNCWAPTTLIGVCTLAVAVMLALFDWAWSAVPVRTRAATTRDSLVMLRIALLLGLVSSFESAGVPFGSSIHCGVLPRQGLCQTPISLAVSNCLTKWPQKAEAKIGHWLS